MEAGQPSRAGGASGWWGRGGDVRILGVSGVSTLSVEEHWPCLGTKGGSSHMSTSPLFSSSPPASSSSLENDTFHGTFTYFSRMYELLNACVDITWRLAVDAAIPSRNPKVPKKVYPHTAVCSLPCPCYLTGGSSRKAITENWGSPGPPPCALPTSAHCSCTWGCNGKACARPRQSWLNELIKILKIKKETKAATVTDKVALCIKWTWQGGVARNDQMLHPLYFAFLPCFQCREGHHGLSVNVYH